MFFANTVPRIAGIGKNNFRLKRIREQLDNEGRVMRRKITVLVVAAIAVIGLARGHAWALGSETPGGGITGTIHDFTAGGHFGATVAVGQCTFCHTPHGALSTSLLWNHTLSGQTYSWDTTATMAGTPFPTFADMTWGGPTAKCLSCHDGTVAVQLCELVRLWSWRRVCGSRASPSEYHACVCQSPRA